MLHVYLLLFVAKKHKEAISDEVKSGCFIFSNGDRYGIPHCTIILFNYCYYISTVYTGHKIVIWHLLNFMALTYDTIRYDTIRYDIDLRALKS